MHDEEETQKGINKHFVNDVSNKKRWEFNRPWRHFYKIAIYFSLIGTSSIEYSMNRTTSDGIWASKKKWRSCLTKYFVDDVNNKKQATKNIRRWQRKHRWNAYGRPRSFFSVARFSRYTCSFAEPAHTPRVYPVFDESGANIIATRSTDYRLGFGWRTMRIKDRPCRSCASPIRGTSPWNRTMHKR